MSIRLGVPVTRGGVPHLDSDTARALFPVEDTVLVLSAFDAIDVQEACKTTNLGYGALIDLKEYTLLLAIRSSLVGPQLISSSTEGVTGETENGRVFLKQANYTQLVSLIQPCVAELLYEPLAVDESSRKRVRTALERTKALKAIDCIPSTTKICDPVDAGVDDDRPPTVSSAPWIHAAALGWGEPSSLRTQILQGLSTTQGSSVIVATANSIAEMQDLVRLSPSGGCVIVCPFPLQLAERGLALGMDGTIAVNCWDSRHRFDRNPLVTGCGCLTCSRHSRGYLHHLLQVHEMNSSILLVIHNYWVAQRFLKR